MPESAITPNKATNSDGPSVTADNARSSRRSGLRARSRRLGVRCQHWWFDRRARFTGAHQDRGMSTAEYAVGTIAACAFAALLFKIVNSPEVNEMLSSLIDRALKING
ncbi:DUF4244 domain-containing protein [Nonomuraea sp. NPDC049714]|uniref:DUF4244 domain-containing protein n=1 Tax=Nonomuraea sp. NPDC049714 TaxID=3364357 RepID=UPI0037898621